MRVPSEHARHSSPRYATQTREYPAQPAPQRTLKIRRRPGTFRGEGHRAAVVNDTQTPERHPTRPRTPTYGRHQRTCASPANMRVTRPRAAPPKHTNTPQSRPHNEEPHVARPALRPKTREYPAQLARERGTSRCEAHSAPQNTRIPRTTGPTTRNLTLRGPLCAPKRANTPHSRPHNERLKYDGGPAPSMGRHRAAVVSLTAEPRALRKLRAAAWRSRTASCRPLRLQLRGLPSWPVRYQRNRRRWRRRGPWSCLRER
ncbi:hypothetical protein PJL18_02601 [Paenarthrobacter nicotinovorans]|nr:hypothetical protein [Paenarthrobacter nicotinovorans]